MDWDHLRYFLELSRGGTLSSAARRLGVNYTTVARRMQALEKSLDVQLFLRTSPGYILTEAGHDLLPQAEAMESAFSAIEKIREAQQEDLSGHVRVGATEGYGSLMLAEQLAELTRRHPNLSIDLLTMPRTVHLSRREVDIVITLERPDRGPFIITKLTDYTLKLYASAEYLARHSPIHSKDDLCGHGFVGYVDDLLCSKELFYLDEIGKPLRISLRSTSILAQQQAVAGGAGIAVLPAFAANADPRLQCVLDGQVELTRTFWMLMPSELREIVRMKTIWNFLREMALSNQDELMGKCRTRLKG